MRFNKWHQALVALCLVIGSTWMGASPSSASPAASTPYSIRAIYVVPAHGHRRTNRPAQIARSIAAMQDWFSSQTGGSTLRFDKLPSGQVAVDYVHLHLTAAKIRAAGIDATSLLESAVARGRHDDPRKLYLMFYEGGNDVACGISPRPPDQPGHMSALYLQGLKNEPVHCNINRLGQKGAALNYWEFVEAHETLHALGMVPDCAPHQFSNGHVNDSNSDLMYLGPDWQTPPVLDVNRDDYYRPQVAQNTDCPNLARSAFLDPTPVNPETPPGWAPYSA